MSLWWLQPGWKEARCSCGKKIWPEGDPDWGECYECKQARYQREQENYPEPQYPGPDDDPVIKEEK